MPDPNRVNSSRSLKWRRAAAAAYFVFTLYALFSPNPNLGTFIPTFSLIHAAAFLVLGFLTEWARGGFSRRITWLLLFIYGPLSECIQPLTGRYFELIDILEDIIGTALGIAAGCLFKALLARRAARKASSSQTGETLSPRGSGPSEDDGAGLP